VKMRNSRNHMRFTLVELLVVIAVMAILISMMVGGFSKMNDKAHGMVCLNNQKSLGVAIGLFLEDNDSIFFPLITTSQYNYQPAQNGNYGYLEGKWPFYLDMYLGGKLKMTDNYVYRNNFSEECSDIWNGCPSVENTSSTFNSDAVEYALVGYSSSQNREFYALMGMPWHQLTDPQNNAILTEHNEVDSQFSIQTSSRYLDRLLDQDNKLRHGEGLSDTMLFADLHAEHVEYEPHLSAVNKYFMHVLPAVARWNLPWNSGLRELRDEQAAEVNSRE
jgi:hypothetical protein